MTPICSFKCTFETPISKVTMLLFDCVITEGRVSPIENGEIKENVYGVISICRLCTQECREAS